MFYDFSELPAPARYKLLAGCILPRPIALVSTVDADGARNAARTEWVAYSAPQIAIVCSVPLFDPHLRPALVKSVRR